MSVISLNPELQLHLATPLTLVQTWWQFPLLVLHTSSTRDTSDSEVENWRPGYCDSLQTLKGNLKYTIYLWKLTFTVNSDIQVEVVVEAITTFTITSTVQLTISWFVVCSISTMMHSVFDRCASRIFCAPLSAFFHRETSQLFTDVHATNTAWRLMLPTSWEKTNETFLNLFIRYKFCREAGLRTIYIVWERFVWCREWDSNHVPRWSESATQLIELTSQKAGKGC